VRYPLARQRGVPLVSEGLTPNSASISRPQALIPAPQSAPIWGGRWEGDAFRNRHR